MGRCAREGYVELNIIITIDCNAFNCKNKVGYIIIWKGKGKPAIFSMADSHDAVCKKHRDMIMKKHKELVQAVIDFADEKVMLD